MKWNRLSFYNFLTQGTHADSKQLYNSGATERASFHGSLKELVGTDVSTKEQWPQPGSTPPVSASQRRRYRRTVACQEV
jgi:hypothetical protein